MSKIAVQTAYGIIELPAKIKRSPTDLLKALSKTVKLEGNTPHYSVIDDTQLLHHTNMDKKRHLLSKAAGIKAAQFMIQKYPEGFMKDDCAPHIPKFFPEKTFTEKDLKYPTEDLVFSLMSWGKFRQAYDTYLKCKDLNIKVSEECKLTLLDFLCIHNSKEEAKKLPVYETWFTETSLSLWQLEKLGAMNKQSSWKSGGEADLMFNELEVKTAHAYCSMIKGMAKYLEEAGAVSLFKEMKEKGLKPDLSTYNEIIRLTRYLKSDNKGKTEYIMEILTEIKNTGLTPNLSTFNNCLLTVCSFGTDQESVIFALNILKEMEFLNIEPSLGTWNSVLNIFYPSPGVGEKTNILTQVLDQVEKADMSGQGLTWRDVNDAHFFKNAMDKCLNYRQNGQLIHRIHSIVMRNNNIKFLNKEQILSQYFDCYLMALMKYEVPEVLMKEWRSLTPLIHSRGIKIMTRMIQYTHDFQCFDFIPEIWSDFVEGRFRRDKDFATQTINQFLDLMVHYQPSDKDRADQDPLIGQYGAIAEIMIDNFPYIEPPKKQLNRTEEVDENKPVYIFEFVWTSKMLSNFFLVCIRANKIALCAKQLDVFLKNQTKISGELNNVTCIRGLFDAFLREGMIEKCIDVLNLALSYQLSSEVNEFKTKLRGTKNLTASQKELIKELKD